MGNCRLIKHYFFRIWSKKKNSDLGKYTLQITRRMLSAKQFRCSLVNMRNIAKI